MAGEERPVPNEKTAPSKNSSGKDRANGINASPSPVMANATGSIFSIGNRLETRANTHP